MSAVFGAETEIAVHFEFVNGHVLALSFGMACLMVGGGAYLLMRAIKDYRELFGSKDKGPNVVIEGLPEGSPARMEGSTT